MSGFVYILSNPSMPGLLKIGSTEKLPTERAVQLYSTGVPEPFKVEFAVWCENHRETETEIHEELEEFRIGDGREFFRTSVAFAIHAICKHCQSFDQNNMSAVSNLCAVDSLTLDTLEHETGVFASAEQWVGCLSLSRECLTVVVAIISANLNHRKVLSTSRANNR
jgi:hypothetical protein